MTAPQKIAGFSAVLVVVFAAAFGIGAVIGPDGRDVTTEHQPTHTEPVAGVQDGAAAEQPAGLTSTEDGYTLEFAQTRLAASRQVPLKFQITDPTGTALTRYVESHEKQLHLIVVRRDVVGFQHVHPTLDGDGTWSVPVDGQVSAEPGAPTPEPASERDGHGH